MGQLPYSLEHLTLATVTGGGIPFNPRFMLLVLQEIWRDSERFANLQAISIRQIPESSCNYCSRRLLHSGLGAEEHPWKYDYLMSAKTMKKMITGTRYYMKLDLRVEIRGLEVGKKDYKGRSYKAMLKGLQEQKYFSRPDLKPKDIEHLMALDSFD